MPVVTKLSEQKRSARINVHIDGKYFSSVTVDQLLEHKIKEGMVVDKAFMGELKVLEVDAKGLEALVRWGSIRPRSEKEFEQYVYKKKISQDLAKNASNILREYGYIDDRRLAEAIVRSRSSSKPTSTRELRKVLMQKGVSASIIDDVAKDFKADIEKENLRKLVEKKRGLSRFQENPQKLKEYLLRKGYSYSDVDELLA